MMHSRGSSLSFQSCACPWLLEVVTKRGGQLVHRKESPRNKETLGCDSDSPLSSSATFHPTMNFLARFVVMTYFLGLVAGRLMLLRMRALAEGHASKPQRRHRSTLSVTTVHPPAFPLGPYQGLFHDMFLRDIRSCYVSLHCWHCCLCETRETAWFAG